MAHTDRTPTRKAARPEWLSRLWRASIWHPGAIPVYEGQTAAELKRGALPLLDLCLIIAGAMAVHYGMPTFDVVYNDVISGVAASFLLASAFAAGVGVVFPRLWRLEAIGKIIMFSILLSYSVGLWGLVSGGVQGRGFVAGTTSALTVIVGWNLWRIGRERRAGTNGKGHS